MPSNYSKKTRRRRKKNQTNRTTNDKTKALHKQLSASSSKPLDERLKQEKYLKLLTRVRDGIIKNKDAETMAKSENRLVFGPVEEVFPPKFNPRKIYYCGLICLPACCHRFPDEVGLMSAPFVNSRGEGVMLLSPKGEVRVEYMKKGAWIYALVNETQELPVDMRLWPKDYVRGVMKRVYGNARKSTVKSKDRTIAVVDKINKVDKMLHRLRRSNPFPSEKQLRRTRKEVIKKDVGDEEKIDLSFSQNY